MTMDKTVKKSYDASFRKKTNSGLISVKIGVAFEDDNGRISVKLDALPISEWDGLIILYPQW